MEPAVVVLLLWLAFAAAHVGLGTARIRGTLVRRFGESGFTLLFSGVAAVLFAALVIYYAANRFEGAPGLALGGHPFERRALMGSIGFGIALMAASFASYDRSPYVVLGEPRSRQPRGLERVTRHPFFMGLTLFALAHVLLATRLVGAVFMTGFAVLAFGGAWIQDRKLLERRGEPFARYLGETSVVPFGAILSGRQRLVWDELPLGGLAAGGLLAVALRGVHDGIFASGGAPFLAAVLGGVAVILAASLGRRRTPASLPEACAERRLLR